MKRTLGIFLACPLLLWSTGVGAQEQESYPPQEGGGSYQAGGSTSGGGGSYRSSRRGRSGGGGGDLLRPGTRPMFFTAGIGPVFFGLNAGRRGRRGFSGFTRGKLALDFGYHFSGDAEGPAIGAGLEQSVGDGRFYLFNPSFKFWWDIEIAGKSIYVAPFGKAGFVIGDCAGGCGAFNLGIGVEGRIIFKDRWMAYFRPLQIDTFMGDFGSDSFLMNYSILIGGGVTF